MARNLKLVLALLCCMWGVMFSQETAPERYLEVRGFAEFDMQPLSQVTANLYEGSNLVKSVKTGSDGRFSFKLETNKQYSIVIEKDGLVSKRISFDTKMPDEEKGTWMNEFSMGLVKPCSGVDYSVLKEPVDKVSFDAKRREFLSDKSYVSGMRSRMERMMIENDKCHLNNYESLVKKADQLASQKKFDEAAGVYRQALEIYPTEDYPARKITEMNAMLNKQQSTAGAYKETIAQADALAAQQNFEQALQKYNQAATLNPQESYPRQKAAEIEKNLAQQQAAKQALLDIEERYNQAMAKASVAYTRKDYATARQYYKEALSVKPSESLPKTRMQEVETILEKKAAEEAARAEQLAQKDAFEKEYNALIQEADQLFKAKKYDEAKSVYAKAINMKPGESYPAQRINTIDNAVAAEQAAREKSMENNYAAAMAAANNALAQNQFTLARESLQKALTIKPNDQIAKSQLASIDEREQTFNRDKALNDQYVAIIRTADGLVAGKEWQKARESYAQALALKPGDAYVQTRIKAVDNAIATEQATLQKVQDDSYNTAMAAANNALAQNQFTLARESLQKALTIKPNDQIAKSQLAGIDEREETYKRDKALNDQYVAIIRTADGLMAGKEWQKARESYTQALALKPGDAYVQTRIKAVDNAIATEQAALQKVQNDSYNSAMTAANNALAQNQFTLARESLQKALTIKPNDQIAKSQLAGIDEREETYKRDKALNDQYVTIIRTADGLMAGKEWQKARESYAQALTLKPGDDYAQTRIKAIDNTVAAEQAALQKVQNDSYNTAMAAGNNALVQNQFQQAKASFQQALTIKPDDATARSRMAETERLADQFAKNKAIEDQYQQVIKTADGLLAAQKLTEARDNYVRAIALKPSDEYAQTRITSINNTIAAEQAARLKATEEGYKAAIGAANTAISQKAYTQAKEYLQKALEIKPGDAFAVGKLAETDRLIAEQQKKLEQEQLLASQYAGIIASADKLFNARDYTGARSAYLSAQQLKPADSYASQKLSEIDNLLTAEKARKQKEIDDAYANTMSKGSGALIVKDFKTAQEAFQQALAIKPGDANANAKLAETNQLFRQEQERLMADQARKKNYDEIIRTADQQVGQQQYASAKLSYEKAIEIMPGESYPRQKLDEVVKAIAEQERIAAENKAKENAYILALANADKYFKAKDYVQARDEFSRASSIKPTETLPKARLAETERLIAQLQKEQNEARTRTAAYTAAINAGKEAFDKKEYSSARSFYTEALKQMPGDLLASDQIKKTDYLIAEAERVKKAEQEKKAAFDALIATADKTFETGNYPSAKESYKKALVIDPNSAYAKQRISRIDEIIRALASSQVKQTSSVASSASRMAAAIPMGELNFKNESERQLYLNELKKKYPAGVTLEKYKEQAREIYRYIIIRDEVQEFRHIKYLNYTGNQYSVNGKPITLQYFQTQIKVREGENFREIDM